MFDISRQQARDSARMAIQSAVAAALTFLIMQSLDMPEKFVALLSAVLVVQPSVGNTIAEARDRVVATLFGSFIGFVCLVLIPHGYGTAGALVISLLFINSVAAFRPAWRYGVVAAVALSLGSENEAMAVAQDRGLAICLGVAVGIITSLVAWPDTTSERVHSHLSTALHAAADRLEDVIKNTREGEDEDQDAARTRYHSNMQDARTAADGVRINDEERLDEKIDNVERLYNSILIINRVAEDSDPLGDDSDDHTKAVEAFREEACSIARSLADGEEFDGSISKIRDQIDDLRAPLGDETDDARERTFQAALIFGLGEVADSLEGLIEAYQETDRLSAKSA
ncbi:MAG: FUSC family protein [Alphaproteobacteria bacterium]